MPGQNQRDGPLSRLASRARRAIRSRTGRSTGLPNSADQDSHEPAEPPAWVATVESPWSNPPPTAAVKCNICQWEGPEFEGSHHCESAQCPRCGSIARDRFLFFCLQERNPPAQGADVLETSSRLGDDYRSAMGRWFAYTSSDYDGGLHRGTIDLDLQNIDLPSESLDVILTPHVLEHVPDTDAALHEIYRVLKPGGRMLLQIPILQGQTAPPSEPEFHEDNTPVFWRFGYDLTARLRAAGFETAALVTQEWAEAAAGEAVEWDLPTSPEFDVDDMVRHAISEDLTVIADHRSASGYGFIPGYMFMTWECTRPSVGGSE